MKSFIVELWSKIFSILRWISFFQIIRKFVPAIKNQALVEIWVLGNLLLSMVLLLVCSAPNLCWFKTIAIILGGIRVFEVFVYQINVLLFDEYRKRTVGETHALRSYRRLVILLLHNYVEIIFWFALFYRNMSWAFEAGGVDLDSFFMSLNFSFVTMTTFGHTNISPKGMLGDILVFSESAIGLFMALLILSRFISLLPPPETSDEFEQRPSSK